ncbi:MAG: TolB-like 6-bladed beta-propeller domain-containing protein [Tannerellaceae bacterium]|jgi:hypothetical protein|nr:TolB-like 6-bladed beta-propeller domain-containing protein [Tannerellaceae bacterium]
MKQRFIIIGLFCIMLCACKKKAVETPEVLLELDEVAYGIDEEDLAQIEGLQCTDSVLIVFDYHSGQTFSLFHLNTGRTYGRFGQIGQGPDEIPLGCSGFANQDMFHLFSYPTSFVARYHLDSLLSNIRSKPLVLTKYTIPDAAFSQVIPINDSLFVGAGVYQSTFQYVLFNSKNEILDYYVEIYNSRNNWVSWFDKFLSNQGCLKKHPGKNQFVYTLNNSGNIDFFEVVDNKIKVINLRRQKNPVYKPFQQGGLSGVVPDAESCIIGYIDISAGNEYVYALYTDHKVDEAYKSNRVLVYDWSGNFVEEYRLNHDAYYITVNERLNRLFAAIRNEDGGWRITSYDTKRE